MKRELVNALDVLAEEAGEIVKVVSKIKRFGFKSYSPLDPDKKLNLTLLGEELGDLYGAADKVLDLYFGNNFKSLDDLYRLIEKYRDDKPKKIKKYFNITEELEKNGQI